jgi:cytochrome c2
MKKYFGLFIVLILLVSLLAACSPAAVPAVEEPVTSGDAVSVSAEDGEALVNSQCTKCHNLSRVTSLKQNEAGWTKTVAEMEKKGLKLNDAERAAIIAYLAENYK